MKENNIASLIETANQKGYHLSLKDGKLSVKMKKDATPDESLLAVIRSKKAALENWLLQYQPTDGPAAFIQQLAIKPDRFPLSGDQERLWLLYQLNEDSSYHIPFATKLTGDIKPAFLLKAFRLLLQKQQVLRTVFVREGENLFQQVIDPKDWQMQERSITTAALDDAIQQEIQVRFDLSEDFPMRAVLFKMEQAEPCYCLVITVHHIVVDGSSLPLLWGELVAQYNILAEGGQPTQTPLPIQYKEFALWQKHQLGLATFAAKIDFWEHKLNGVPRVEVPDDLYTDNKAIRQGKTLRKSIDAAVSSLVLNRCNEKGVSPFIYTLAVFKTLLFRYTRQNQICIGFPITERWHSELEPLVGLFVNTLPIYTEVSPTDTFDSVLEAVKKSVLEAYAYKEVPFEKIVERLAVARDIRINPLFEIVFAAYHSNESNALAALSQVAVEQIEIENRTAKFALNCAVTLHEGKLLLSIEYDANRYTDEKMEQFAKHYLTLLASCAKNGSVLLQQIDFLDDVDKTVINSISLQDVAYPQEATILSCFEDQVRLYPHHVALTFEGVDFTYGQLNKRVNQLAHYLIKKGVIVEQPVVVCTTRTPALMIGLLAVMKAGGVYVPVNPTYPEDRIRFIIEDCNPKVVITDLTYFTAASGSDIIYLGEQAADIALCPETNPAITILPENLLYIIYTSGTTGRPKGVMIEHRNVVRLFFTEKPLFTFSQTDVWTLFHSFCFDFSVWEMYGALLYGGKLVIVGEDTVKDAAAFASLLEKEQVTVLNQTPAAFYNLQEAVLASRRNLALRYVIFGGEALHPAKLAKWYETYPDCQFINMYGITETTVHVTFKIIGKTEIEKGSSNIGCAIPTLGCLILDEQGNLMPPGTIGELFVTGAGLARGYLNRPELTATRFLPNPYRKNAYMYKSGDLAYLGLDGDLRYIGRGDAQVKIRGHRIEIGEVENVLLALAEVDNGVVNVLEKNGHNRLIAYVVAANGKTKQDISLALQDKLPDFMVPSVLVLLDKIPLTSNGKVDKKALPSPDEYLLQERSYMAPQHPVEIEICKIWQQLLGIERISVEDNFFDLGGDSIIAMQAVNHINKVGFSVSAKDIFTYQNIAALAQKIRSNQSLRKGEQGMLSGSLPLLPIQQRFLNDAWTGMHHYNQSFLLNIDKELPVQPVQEALTALTGRHDALRIRFSFANGAWEQFYSNDNKIALLTETITVGGPIETKELITVICSRYQQSFQLEQGNLFTAVLIVTPETEIKNRLLLVAHHLIVDAVSWRIILNDLESLLGHTVPAKALASTAKSNSLREWANALHKYAASERALAQLPYWQGVIDCYQPLPVDKAPLSSQRKDCREVLVSLDHTYTEWLIKDAHKAYHTEINDLLLAALLISVGEWSGRYHVVTGLEGHGRDGFGCDLNVSDTVGWFTSLYPVALQANDLSDVAHVIASVKERLRAIPDKGMAFGALAYLNPLSTLLTSLPEKQPWDIVFNYLGRFDNVIKGNTFLDGATENKGDYCSAEMPWRLKMEINSSVQNGQLDMSWTFSELDYEATTITSLAQNYLHVLKALIDHCRLIKRPVHTPSDFGLSPEVSMVQLDTFLKLPEQYDVQSICRLSPLQAGMLFHGLYESQLTSYQEQFTCFLPGAIHVDALKKAWESLVRHHSIFRACLLPDTFSIPVQCIYRTVELPFIVLDYSGYSETERNAIFAQFLEADLQDAIPFHNAPLMRITLVKWGNDGYRMVWTHHHSIMDGWSVSIVLGELMQAYESFSQNLIVDNPIEDRYENYIQFLALQDPWKEQAFWQGYLNGFEQPTLLPQLQRKGASNRTAGISGVCVWKPGKELGETIDTFIKSNHITANTLIQGVWVYLLAQYTGSKDVVFGVTVSGRPSVQDSFQKGVGLYINTIPLRAQLSWETPVVNWLQHLQQEQIAAREYQYTPLNQIQVWNKLPEDWFDTILIYENYPLVDATGSAYALQIESGSFKERTNYALNIVAGMSPTLQVEFNYNTALLSLEEIDRIRDYFERIIQQFCEPAALLANVDMLTEAERERLLNNYNTTDKAFPEFSSLSECIEQHVVQAPDSAALRFEGTVYSYAALHHAVMVLAHQLRQEGVLQGDLVGISMKRLPEMVVAILAILKVGAAYVPIDPSYPSERINYMVDNAGIRNLLFTGTENLHFSSEHTIQTHKVSCKDLLSAPLPQQQPSWVKVVPTDLAYVIYTSGSTGQPKGVMITHGAALNTCLSQIRFWGIGQTDNVLQFASLSFDASVSEIFTALCSGAALTIVRKAVIDDPSLFEVYIKQENVTILTLPPTYLAAIQEDCLDRVKVLVTAGEPPEAEKAIQLSKRLRYFNAYGPTECAVCVTVHEVTTDTTVEAGIPIGMPIDNTRVYILDDRGKLLPEGVMGELHVAGAGLSKGYWNNATLTNQKFVPCPFEANGVMYNTGDLACWLPGGKLAYLGRKDQQVKIRGHRIELAEIEYSLKQLYGIDDAVVQVFKNKNGLPFIAAYLVAKPDIDIAIVANHLTAQLPAFMVPSSFTRVDYIPLSPNGKVDRSALPAPDFASLSTEQIVPPTTKEEITIMEIWQDLLGKGEWGIHHDFFRLGGHSLLIIRMAAAVKLQLDVHIPVQKLYELRTIARIAAYAKHRSWKQEKAADASIEVFEL